MTLEIEVKADEAAVIAELCSRIEELAKVCLTKSDSFHLGLSGGSLAKFLCKGLPSIQTDWARWKIFFCDERLVPEDSADSTWGLYKKQLLELVPLKDEQFLRVRTELEPEKAAKDYQDQIEASLGSPPVLHVLLLGAGPDGHTCSLFPGHALMHEPAPTAGGRIVASIVDSPKPPPARVTLTMPVVNSAEWCIFAATGAAKSDTMAQLLGPAGQTDPLPARLVNPPRGNVLWILDAAAAEKLPK